MKRMFLSRRKSLF